MSTEQKIAGPWEQDGRGGWKRVGVNGIPYAEVWPRGFAGYGWAALDAEGLESEAVTSDGNLIAAKRAADAALTAVGCGLIAAWPPVGHTVRLPRPFEARAADFARDLQALAERYSVAIVRGDVIDMIGGAKGFRPSLVATERDRAWARLVAAHIAATNAAKGQSDILADLAAKDIESAEQALRDLGVDAHALILEAIDDPSLFPVYRGVTPRRER